MKILIANRGEIAVRIIRSLKEMGITTAAIYSDADVDCMHTKLADEAYNIGPAPALKSYLVAQNIVRIAKQHGVDAIHPGYGFLSENESFAAICEEAGLLFIGPTPQNLALSGDKLQARVTVEKMNIPVIPGSDEALTSLDQARAVASDIGYPLMLKASAGGGGRGMRVITNGQTLEEEFKMAAAEARAAFGNPTLYLEKYIESPRHIEVQILGDGYGNAIHLAERNCSIQKRHQKLIEEAPSPRLNSSVRKAIHSAAVKIASDLGYRNAGTVEFLVDGKNRFYFMELNARIQVEHPVTEMITGIDLVKAQIGVAVDKRIDVTQKDIRVRGHAIECRINAEDPEMGFLPSPGTVERFHPPGGFGVRFDTHMYSGYQIPIYYDSLLGKLIAWGATRTDALNTMRRALNELSIEPVKTTKNFLLDVVSHARFIRGDYRLDFVDKIINGGEL
jgi:acetyl-CoA carboxylase biotin carboxylase subunit